MNARSAARELTLISFAQLTKNLNEWSEKSIEQILVSSVRTLVGNAESELKNSIGELGEIREFFQNYEIEHPENTNRPIDSRIYPVGLPLTSDMINKVDILLDSADKALTVLELSEISALENRQDVKEYIFKLAELYKKNHLEIDDIIKNYSKGWDIDRLVKIDRNILRISLVELLYIDDIPVNVSVDEAVELSKKYSTDESSKFINGILGQYIDKNNLYAAKVSK